MDGLTYEEQVRLIDIQKQADLDKKTDSISVSKTSTGKFSFDIKIYGKELNSPESQQQTIANIKAIMDKLQEVFPQ